MIALTVRPPWSFAIAQLRKDIENRVWKTSHRGLLAVHAGAAWDGDDAAKRVFELTGALVVKTDTSAVVAVADLVDIHLSATCIRPFPSRHTHPDGAFTCSKWAAGLGEPAGVWHWQLANVRRLAEPVACKGRQRLWSLPDSVEAAVLAQLARGAVSVSRDVQASGHPDSPTTPPDSRTAPPAPDHAPTPRHRNEGP